MYLIWSFEILFRGRPFFFFAACAGTVPVRDSRAGTPLEAISKVEVKSRGSIRINERERINVFRV